MGGVLSEYGRENRKFGMVFPNRKVLLLISTTLTVIWNISGIY